VAGRERIYLDRIWNDFTGDPSKPDEATRNFFAASYAQPGGMRAGFAQFTAFFQDAKDNKIFEQVKLTMPVLAVGGEKSFGPCRRLIIAPRGDECSRGGRCWLRALADGRAACGNRGADSQLSRLFGRRGKLQFVWLISTKVAADTFVSTNLLRGFWFVRSCIETY